MRKRPDVPLLTDVLENFSAHDSTRLGVAFGHVLRYFAFLHYILEEYEEAGRDYIENTKTMTAMFQDGVSGNPFTAEQTAILDQGPVLHDLVHLRIETFYLFAKIFLDKIAHFLEFYFGQGRGLSLDSHDQLVKNFEAFSESKSLVLPADFLTVATGLKSAISDHRDYQIQHEKSPQTMYGTSYNPEGETTIMQLRLNPTEKDRQINSAPLGNLLKEADGYFRLTVELVKTNADKSVVKRDGAGDGEFARVSV